MTIATSSSSGKIFSKKCRCVFFLPLIISEFSGKLQVSSSKHWRSEQSFCALQLSESLQGPPHKWSVVRGHNTSLHIAGNRRSHAQACLWGHSSQKRALVRNSWSATRIHPAGYMKRFKELQVCLHTSISASNSLAELQDGPQSFLTSQSHHK